MDVGRNWKTKLFVRQRYEFAVKIILEIFLKCTRMTNGVVSLVRMTQIYKPILFFFIYNWHSLWKLPSSNLASSLQSRLIISLPLSNDENFTLNLARHLLTYILSSGLEQEQCSGIKSFLTSNFYFLWLFVHTFHLMFYSIIKWYCINIVG
jgi:hypothetical protein